MHTTPLGTMTQGSSGGPSGPIGQNQGDGEDPSESVGAGTVDKLTVQFEGIGLGSPGDDLLLDEGDEADIDSGAAEKGVEAFPVVGTILTDKVVRFQALRDLMASLWR
ncbi:unnamed protein product [Cuscuta epithymum]|uniref:Uncharacterized protein n=1 Tax=Cuscuta epithymum TaxID=186058 RepID=A0AAV0DVT7_9ASTE|nr:unnamed protein product [Cuscuta epithymum]